MDNRTYTEDLTDPIIAAAARASWPPSAIRVATRWRAACVLLKCVRQAADAGRGCHIPDHLGTENLVRHRPDVACEAAVLADRPKGRPELVGGTETVLVCEDDDLVRGFVKAVFSEGGYDVLYASVPQEALALAAAHGVPIDVLVTDVVMPQMSGPELAERLVMMLPGLKVVFMSGYTAEAMRCRGDLLPGSVFVEKTSVAVSLLGTIRALLDSGTPPHSAAAWARPRQ